MGKEEKEGKEGIVFPPFLPFLPFRFVNYFLSKFEAYHF